MPAPPPDAGSTSPQDGGEPPLLLLLGDPTEDPTWLSPPLCLVRSQIEVFAATSADVSDRTRHPPTVGQVGLRCVHCRPPHRRTNATCAKGAVSYPKKLGLVHQTVRNFQRYHVLDCPDMPADVKDRLQIYAAEKKQHQSRRDAAAYWVSSFRSLGVRDAINVSAGVEGAGMKMMREEIRFVDERNGTAGRVPFDDDGDTSTEINNEVDLAAIQARRVYVPVPNHPVPPPPPPPEAALGVEEPSSAAGIRNDGGTDNEIDDATFLTAIDDDLVGSELSTLRAALGPDEEEIICQQSKIPSHSVGGKGTGHNAGGTINAADDNTVLGKPTQPDTEGLHQKKNNGLVAIPKKATASLRQFISHRPPSPDPTESTADASSGSKKRHHRRISDKEMAAFDDEDAPPAYSDQDELRELSSLSISEVVARESDLRGFKRNGNQQILSVLHDAEILEVLDDELASLRGADSAAYREALVRCPDQVSDERRMRFICAAFGDLPAGELNSVLSYLADPNREYSMQAQRNQIGRTAAQVKKLIKASAEALARHWQLRHDLFGPDRCYLSMSVRGVMEDEVDNLVNCRVVQLLPIPDGSGRAIIYSDLTRRDFDKYSIKQEMMALFYLMEVAAEDPNFLRAGFISLHNSFGLSRSSFNRSAREFAAKADDFSPLTCRALHVINPSFIVHHVVLPIVKSLFGKALRLRIATHRGPPDKILRELEQYRLPKECVPIELGGTLQFDMKKWVAERSAIELERDKKLNAAEAKLSPPLRTNLSPAIEALMLDKASSTPKTDAKSATKRARLSNTED